MTEKELISLLQEKGFVEKTIMVLADSQRTFIGTDINNNEITITFDGGKGSYEKVSMKVSGEFIQTPKNVEISELDKIKMQPPKNNSTSEDDAISEKADQEDFERFRGINLTEYTTIESIAFNTEAFESLKNKSLINIKVNLEEVETLRKDVCSAANDFKEYVTVGVQNIVNSFDKLNKKTYEKLKIDLEDFKFSIQKTYINNITEGFNDLIAALTQNINDNEFINRDGGGKSTTPKQIDEIIPEIPIDKDNLDKLTPAIAGMVTFTEVVSMYTSIGSENPVQSSLTGNYGVLGLVHKNDKYYYKIIDKSNGQVYFVEMNDKAKITWDERGERETVEIVEEGVNILKLPQEGDVLVRNPEVGDVYFLNGEKMTFDGIDYYFITDNVTGEVAYIPLGSGVSEPTLVSNLGSYPSSNSSSEVIE